MSHRRKPFEVTLPVEIAALAPSRDYDAAVRKVIR